MTKFTSLHRHALAALLAVCAGTVLFSDVAWAGGVEFPENGPRALGRGGAFVAGVDDASAVYFNPGALSRSDGFNLSLGLNLVDLDMEFERSPFIYQEDGREQDRFRREIQFQSVENEGGVFPAPMFFMSHDFGLEDFTFGFGVYGPSAYGTPSFPKMDTYPEDDPDAVADEYTPSRSNPIIGDDEPARDGGQAYMIVDQSILLFYPSLSVAYELEKLNLSLGLSAQLVGLIIDFTVGVDGDSSQTTDVDRPSTEAEGLYAETVLEARGYSGTGILGFLWEPSNRFALGGHYRMRYNIQARGEIDIDFPPLGGVDVGFLQGDGSLAGTADATVDISFPDIFRLGAVYTHRNAADREIFDLELNVNYEAWARLKAFVVNVDGFVDDSAGTLGRTIPELSLRRNFNNVVGVRLGSEISALRNAETGNGPVFRLGGFFETNAQPEEWTNLDFVSWARVGATLGFGYHIGPVSIDTAFSYMWSPEREVDNGRYDVLMPLWVCEDPPTEEAAEQCAGVQRADVVHAVNNGTYRSSLKIFSLGLTYGW